MMSKGENKKRYCKESEEELKKAYRENPRPDQNVCMGLEISRRFLMVLRLLVRAGLLPMDLQ